MATQEWFVRIGEKTYGPHTADKLREAARSGKLTPDNSVRKGLDGKWVTASKVRGLEFPDGGLGVLVADAPQSFSADPGAFAAPQQGDLTFGRNGQAIAATSNSIVMPDGKVLITGEWEPLEDVYVAGRCPITGQSDVSAVIEVAMHRPMCSSTYDYVPVSKLGAKLHRENRSMCWVVYDRFMRIPLIEIPLIGLQLQILQLYLVLCTFPVWAVVDMARRRPHWERGHLRREFLTGLMVRRVQTLNA